MLGDLKPEVAKNCLLLWQQSLQTKIIQSPVGYLHYLVKAARQGTLDCSLLTPATSNTYTPKTNPADTQQRLRALQAEIYTLHQLFKQAGTAMDERSAARRACMDKRVRTVENNAAKTAKSITKPLFNNASQLS